MPGGRIREHLAFTRPRKLKRRKQAHDGDLAWMSGDWQTAAGGRAQIEEHWTTPAGGSMIGMGRTIAGDKTVEFEYLRLEQRADAIYYVAHPKARCPGTDFKLTRLSAKEAVFENPQHDFPKRVTYQKNSDGSLTASIDGGEGTKSQKFAYFPMRLSDAGGYPDYARLHRFKPVE